MLGLVRTATTSKALDRPGRTIGREQSDHRPRLVSVREKRIGRCVYVRMVRVIYTESLRNKPQHLESPRGARGAATRCRSRERSSLVMTKDASRLSNHAPHSVAVLASSGHRRAPLALSVHQAAGWSTGCPWWTERARPASRTWMTQARERSERAQRVPGPKPAEGFRDPHVESTDTTTNRSIHPLLDRLNGAGYGTRQSTSP